MINFLINKQSKRDATQRRPMIREKDIKLDYNWITSPRDYVSKVQALATYPHGKIAEAHHDGSWAGGRQAGTRIKGKCAERDIKLVALLAK